MFSSTVYALLLFSALTVVNHARITSDMMDRLRNRISSNVNHPVILIPGDGGSQLEAKLDKPNTVHYFCEKKTTDFFDLWVNLELMVPYVLDCWVDNMRLLYDNQTRKTSNPPGVEIRVPGFGNTTTVEWLDPSQVSPSAYYTNIVQAFLDVGYEKGISIRGAPYDFRKAPNELGDYFVNFKTLVEETYSINNRIKVVLVCHSMGCPNMRYFLSNQPQAWKDKYIRALVSLGGAWGGSVKALKAFASGENLGVVVINPLTVRAEQRSAPSLAYLAPNDAFWKPSEVLVTTPTRNYTIADYRDFFTDIDFFDGYHMWKDTRDYIRDQTPPGVELHCLHGMNVSTIERMVYTKKGFPDVQPELVYGDGDGTVNLRSLLGCRGYSATQKQKVYVHGFPNVDHMGILAYQGAIDYIKNLSLNE